MSLIENHSAQGTTNNTIATPKPVAISIHNYRQAEEGLRTFAPPATPAVAREDHPVPLRAHSIAAGHTDHHRRFWILSGLGVACILITAWMMKVAGCADVDIQWSINAEIMIFSIVLGPIYARAIA